MTGTNWSNGFPFRMTIALLIIPMLALIYLNTHTRKRDGERAIYSSIISNLLLLHNSRRKSVGGHLSLDIKKFSGFFFFF